jgi:hypothetical protein
MLYCACMTGQQALEPCPHQVLVEAVHVVLLMYDRSAGFGALPLSGLGGGGTCCTAHV